MAPTRRTPAIFIKAEEGVSPALGGETAIKLGKYSCAHYIFNELLIRIGAVHTGHSSCPTCKDVSLVFPRN